MSVIQIVVALLFIHVQKMADFIPPQKNFTAELVRDFPRVESTPPPPLHVH